MLYIYMRQTSRSCGRTGVAISLPLDLICEVPAGEEPEAHEAEKGYVVPLKACWRALQGPEPLYFGTYQGQECYGRLEEGLLKLHVEGESAAESALEVEEAPDTFMEGVRRRGG